MAILEIPITKAGNKKLKVDTDELFEVGEDHEMYTLVMLEGLKSILNKNMSKILTKDLEGEKLEEARTEAYEKGLANLEKLMTGKLKVRGAKATDESGAAVSKEVLTEARRLAKNAAKDEYKASGGKVHHVEAKAWTAAADTMIKDDPWYIEQAKANLAERKSRTSKAIEDEDERKAMALARIEKLGIKASDKLVKKDAEEKEAKKKERAAKSTLSKTQAGKVAPRARPRTERGPESHTQH